MLAFISVITVVLIFLNLDEPLVLVLDSMFLFLFAIVIFANIYSFYGLVDGTVLDAETGLEVAKITHDKYDTFYFSIVTWTTLGYGDWQPTQSVKIFAAVQALVGMYSTALLFGLFTYSFGLRNKRDS
ncbi:ion channel [Roseibium sp.]|uniref:ion channel n=1 Tax=Roseibium sp. TaxID=1936156 RepID=UPI003BB10B1B